MMMIIVIILMLHLMCRVQIKKNHIISTNPPPRPPFSSSLSVRVPFGAEKRLAVGF